MIFALNQDTGGIGLNTKGFFGQFQNNIVTQLSESDASGILTQFNTLVKEGSVDVDKFVKAQSNTSGMRGFLSTVKDGNAQFPAYVQYVNESNASYKKMTLSAKAATLATQALNTAISMGSTLLISWGLSLAIGEIDKFVRANELAIEKAQELTSEWEENDAALEKSKSTIESIGSEYETLSKGIGLFGKNLSLTEDQYKRYNEIANQIADLFPDMIQGYTDEGTAIVKVTGKVDDLTAAYERSKKAAQDAVLASFEDVYAGYKASTSGDEWYGADVGRSKSIRQANLQELENYVSGNYGAFSKQSAADFVLYGFTKEPAGVQIAKELNVTVKSIDDLVANYKKFAAYKATLDAEINTILSSVKQGVMISLESTESYSKLSDDAKNIIGNIVQNLDNQFFSQFSNGTLAVSAIQDMYVDAFSKIDFSSIINSKSLFDTGKISVGGYEKALAEFLKSISGFAPEVQDSLSETFSPDTDTLVANVQGKLQDAYDESVKSLTLDQLKVAANLQISEGTLLTWDQLIAKIKESQTAALQSIDSLSSSIKPLTEMYDILNSAISEQSKNGTMSYETYNKLIAANADFANAISIVDGQLKIDVDKAYEAADAHTKLQESLAEAAQAAKQTEYDKVADSLEEVNDKLREMDELGYQNNLYDSLQDQKDALESQRDSLAKELQQYQSITSQIKGMTSAYYQYLRAKQTPDQGEEYDQFKGAKDDLKEGLSTGKTGTDDFQSAVALMLGGSSDGLTPQEKKKRYALAKKKYDRYITDSSKGGGNFLKDITKGGLATKKGKEYILNEGVTGQQIADELGISLDAVKAIIGELEEYEGQFDWSKLFGETKEEYEQSKEDKFDQQITELTTGVDKYTAAVDEQIKRVEEKNAELDAALGIPAESSTPNPPSGGAAPQSSTDNRKSEGLETPSTVVPTTNVYATKTINLLLHIVDGEIERVTSEIDGIAGEATVTANDDDVTTTLAQLGIDLASIPTGTVTLSLTDESGAVQSVTSMKEALALINEGASATVTITLPPDTTQEDLELLNTYLAYLPPEVLSKITVDYSAVSPAVTDANAELGKVEDKTALIDGNTQYISGDVDRANELLSGVENPVADITADASTVPTTVSKANAETANLKDRTITITTVYEPGGGGEGGHGAYSGEPAGTSTTGGGRSKENKVKTSSSEGTPADLINVENIEEAQAQMTIFQAIWQKILSLFGQDAPLIKTIISSSAQSEISSAESGLKGIADTTIPEKTVDLNTDDALAKNKSLEDELDDTVTKKVQVEYSGATHDAWAKGTKHAKEGLAVVDDGTGKEAIIRKDGTAEIGTDNGPRLTYLNDGDQVLNAEDTDKMLKQKGMKIPRFADGSPGSIYWDIPSSSTSSSNTSSSKKNTSKKIDWKKYVDKLFDWIEIRLQKLQKITDDWKREIEKAIGYVSKNATIDKTISSITDQISALGESYARYLEQANQIQKKTKLSDDIVSKIQNGTIDIASYSSSVQDKIKAYQEWYEKAQDVKNEIIDLKDEQEELIHQKLDNIVRYYENVTDVLSNAVDKANAEIGYKTSAGREVTAADYQPAITAQTQKVQRMREEMAALTAEFNKQIVAGTLTANSDAWFDYTKQIAELDIAITEANTDLNDLNDSVKNIVVTNLGYMLTALQTTQASIEQTLSLIEAQGRTATTDSYKQLIANGMQQISNLQQQNAALRLQQAGLDQISEKYQEIQQQIDSNNASIVDIKVNQEQWNDSILDLRIDELQKLKDQLEKTNDEYQRNYDLQQAIEDLERAKSQRKIRILENGQFKYVADTQAVAEQQRALDEKLHDQTMAKIDDAIDAIDGLKASNNVYEALGLTPTSIGELFPNTSVDDLIGAVVASAKAGVGISDLAQSVNTATAAMVQAANNTTNSQTVNVGSGAIIIQTGANASEVIDVLQSELTTVFTQYQYGK